MVLSSINLAAEDHVAPGIRHFPITHPIYQIVKSKNTNEPHQLIATEFRHALSVALLDGMSQHLLAVTVAMIPSLVLIVRLCHPTSIVTSRLIRALLSFAALLYFPSLLLWTSIVLTILTFLLRHTCDVEVLLHRLCNSVTVSVISKLSDFPLSSTLTLAELRYELKQNAEDLRRREEAAAKSERRSPLRALVRILTDFGIKAALAALIYVASGRFRDAAIVVNPLRPKRLSLLTVIAILRTEMVSAVLLPFKASIKAYLYSTVVVAFLLIIGPVWLLW